MARKFEEFDSFEDLLPEDYQPRMKRFSDMGSSDMQKDGIDLSRLVAQDRSLAFRSNGKKQKLLGKRYRNAENLHDPKKWVFKR